MSQLRNDPIRVVPKRALILALFVTAILLGIAILFQLPILFLLGGFWLGVAINLFNFRLIVIGSKNVLEKREAGIKASIVPNYFLRVMLYGLVFVIAWRINTWSMVGSFIGATMVSTAIRLDGFFSFGYKKEDLEKDTHKEAYEEAYEEED